MDQQSGAQKFSLILLHYSFPDDPSDRIWKPDFTDVLEENHSSQTEKPFPYEFLWQPTSPPPRTPLTLNTRAENPQRSLVDF
jgi:hypothetical protein